MVVRAEPNRLEISQQESWAEPLDRNFENGVLAESRRTAEHLSYREVSLAAQNPG